MLILNASLEQDSQIRLNTHQNQKPEASAIIERKQSTAFSHLNIEEEQDFMNARSEMFDYFRREEYQCEAIEFATLDLVFEE